MLILSVCYTTLFRTTASNRKSLILLTPKNPFSECMVYVLGRRKPSHPLFQLLISMFLPKACVKTINIQDFLHRSLVYVISNSEGYLRHWFFSPMGLKDNTIYVVYLIYCVLVFGSLINLKATNSAN